MTSAERTAEATGRRDLTAVTLSTPRLTLREFRETDIDTITEACQDDEIQHYTMVPAPYRRSHAERFVREICPAGRAAGTDAVFGAFVTDSGALVGAVGLHNIAHLDEAAGGSAGIGYWTAPWSRRRGYTSEAVRARGSSPMACGVVYSHFSRPARCPWQGSRPRAPGTRAGARGG